VDRHCGSVAGWCRNVGVRSVGRSVGEVSFVDFLLGIAVYPDDDDDDARSPFTLDEA